jgi:aldehyde dehydrogenase (NAD+)
MEPTVFADVQPEMQILREEIFGPVVCVLPFSDIEEVLQEANNSDYGLAAGIWTKDLQNAHKTASALKAGTVWINCYNVFDAASPFGGYKQSGYGREMGKQALDLYTQTKSVWVGL